MLIPYSNWAAEASLVCQVMSTELAMTDNTKIEEISGAVMSGGTHDCVSPGRLAVVPQLFESVQILVWLPAWLHADHAVHVKDSVHAASAKSRPSSMLQPSAPVS